MASIPSALPPLPPSALPMYCLCLHRSCSERVARPLLTYILLISAFGPLAALSAAGALYTPLSGREMLWVGMLLVLAKIAERFPLHLTHKTNINVTAAAFIVM